MDSIAAALVKTVRYLGGKSNGFRLRAQLAWLRLQGVRLGKNVYIARNVSFKIGAGSRLAIGDNVSIYENCRIIVNDGSTLEIGDHTFVMHDCEISSSADTVIGRYCSFAPYCMVIDSDHVYADPHTPIRLQGAALGKITIGDEVWLAAKAIVLKGVTIGRHSVIGAGSVVTEDVPELSVAAGVPAKVLKRIS